MFNFLQTDQSSKSKNNGFHIAYATVAGVILIVKGVQMVLAR